MIFRITKNYLRDKTGVFMSLLTVVIILILYLVFLGDNLVNNIESKIGATKNIADFVNIWVLAGMLTVAPITLSLGVFNIKIEDDLSGKSRALSVTPTSRFKIVSSYIIAGLVVASFITVLTFIIGIVYFKLSGITVIALNKIPYLLFLIFINSICSVTMMFLFTTFIKSRSSFTSFTTIIGTVIGFLAGIYLPIGNLPELVQSVMKFSPFTYSAALFRELLLEKSLTDILNKLPESSLQELQEFLGIIVIFKGVTVTPLSTIIILICTTLICSLVAISRIKYTLNDTL